LLLKMRRSPWALPVGGVVVAVLVIGGLVALIMASCGGNSNAKAQSIIQKFLEVGQNPGTNSEVFVDKAPPDLPKGLPEYPGSKIVGSIKGVSGGVAAYSVLRETGDDVDTVYAFYDQAFSGDSWQVSMGAASKQYDALQFASTGDTTISGSVMIQPSDGKSIIFLTVQTAATESPTTEPFTLSPSKALPRDWPDSIPVYPDATITDSAWQEDVTSQWQVILLAQVSPADVLSYYKTQLAAGGFTTTDEAPQGTAEQLSFEKVDGAQTWSGSLSVDAFNEDPTYAQATIQLSVGASATPQPSPTAAPSP
jgi:hypothetical protein